MKINIFGTAAPLFKGRREDKNTVNQLKQDNNYSLTENNKIRIEKAIDNLANETGENNIKFLLEVADGLTYGTNIDLGKKPEHDWREKLHNAAEHSMSISDIDTQKKYTPILNRTINTKKELTEDEKEIVKTRASILSQLDLSQLDNEKNSNIKNVESNLDYFITSSSTTTKQKKYVLNRLNHFLSPEYKINPQLENKKTKVFAEMINDLVVDTPDSVVPNTKAINQKSHGMCAAISIARKLMSYEDKANYTDSILSELDNTPVVMVYDKTRLGKGIRVPVKKAEIDFVDAENKGYRIVDASTTQWMNIADMYDSDSTSKFTYVTFDRENFGAMNDEHFLNPIPDTDLATKHRYYQALLKSKETIGSAKSAKLKSKISDSDNKLSKDNNIQNLAKLNTYLKDSLKSVIPGISDKESHKLAVMLTKLEQPTSNKIDKKFAKYSFIPNEESVIKQQKVENFINDTFKNKVDKEGLSSQAKDITSTVEDIFSLNNELHPASTMSAKVAYNRKLYNAAAAYRNQVEFSLNDKDYTTDKMIKYNIPDKESLLSKNIDSTIKYINKTSDPNYINHFSNILNLEPDKATVVDTLDGLRNGIDYLLDEPLDNVYKKLGMGDKRQVLLSIVSSRRSAMEQGDKVSLKDAAFCLNTKPDKQKLVNEYTKFEKTLAEGATDKQYVEIFNKIGQKDQLQAFADTFGIVVDAVNNPDDEINQSIISNFLEANKLPEDTSIDDTRIHLQKVGDEFNSISQNIAFMRNMMTISDDNGEILNKATASHYVMKKMENNGEVIPRGKLIPLRDRFDAIDKLRSQDEFSSRQGKISNPELYKFTSGEKETLKQIDKSINQMYSDVNKEMDFVLKEIREPLEKHSRKMGVSTGTYWVRNNTGGLHSEQEVKIIQQMTDRKYQTIEDFDRGIDKIKNTPYSGISCTSVFHDRIGGHAQYIAEISPVGPTNKDALYHDNSWGASENENTWIDSEGLKRTDYSDIRGGELGYITNDKYRNGNYVENLLTKGGEIVPASIENKQLRKLSGNESGYKFPLLYDIIVPGSGEQIKEAAAGMHDTIFVSKSVDDLVNSATQMTKEEILAAFVRHETAGKTYQEKIKRLDKQIYGTGLKEGIKTEADYNALAENDSVKLTFEKAAISLSYPDGVNWKRLAKATTQEDINKLKKERDKNAKEYFDYAFGKENGVFMYYAQAGSHTELMKSVKGIFDKYSINYDSKTLDNKFATVIKNCITDKNYDGSIANGIKKAANNAVEMFTKDMPESDKLNPAKKEIGEIITNDMVQKLYIKESDLNNTSSKFKAITNYIDKKYNPETNEDFVNIYRKLQDMTKDDFDKEISADITPKDLDIKNINGFDVLKRYKASLPQENNAVKNLIYQQELLNDLNLSDTKPYYKYNKLYKYHQGDFYMNGKNFDDNYRDFSMTLYRMEYPKLFNENKDDGLRNYGALPSYPYINPIDDEGLNKKYKAIEELVYNQLSAVHSKKETMSGYELVDKISTEIGLIPEDKKATPKQRKRINNLVGKFITEAADDSSIQKSINSANAVLALDKNATGMDYKIAVEGLETEYGAIKRMNSEETLKNGINEDLKYLQKNIDLLMNFEIQDKHQNKVKNEFNEWIREELRPEDSEALISKSIKKLRTQIDSYSLPKKGINYTKTVYLDNLETGLNSLVKIQDGINATDKDSTKEKLAKKFVTNAAALEETTKTFVNGNISPMYQDTVLKSVDTISKKVLSGKAPLYNQERVNEARDRFYKDYEKYNFLNDGNGLLKSIMLLNAKDGRIHSSDNTVAKEAKFELNSKMSSLSSVINCAEMIKLQEFIMDAVSTGNASSIVEKFKEYESVLYDPKTGLPLTLDDPKSVDYMVQSMVMGQNDETAVMFIDKLGLADKFIKAQNDSEMIKYAKKDVRKIANILNTTYGQFSVARSELDRINNSDINTSDDYARIIDESKNNIIEKTAKMNRKKVVKNYLKALDIAKGIIDENPEISRTAIINQIFNEAFSNISEITNGDIAPIQTRLNTVSTLHNLINKLSIPEYSGAFKEKEKFEKTFKEFEDYNNTLLTKVINNTNSDMNIEMENR